MRDEEHHQWDERRNHVDQLAAQFDSRAGGCVGDRGDRALSSTCGPETARLGPNRRIDADHAPTRCRRADTLEGKHGRPVDVTAFRVTHGNGAEGIRTPDLRFANPTLRQVEKPKSSTNTGVYEQFTPFASGSQARAKNRIGGQQTR